jgi:hypothetical protein
MASAIEAPALETTAPTRCGHARPGHPRNSSARIRDVCAAPLGPAATEAADVLTFNADGYIVTFETLVDPTIADRAYAN